MGGGDCGAPGTPGPCAGTEVVGQFGLYFDLVRNTELIATEGMAFQSYVALLLILVSSDAFHFNRQLRLSRVNYQKCASNDDVFGAEFITAKTKLISADSNEVVEASLPLSPSAEIDFTV